MRFSTMPTKPYYQGLKIADMLRKMASHHSEKNTRHISKFETSLLNDAADIIDSFVED
jgi:hypothetical protein